MATVSARYLDLARKSKRELDAVFAAGSPPDVSALTGFEFRGYNQPRAAALLGIRKFIKAFYLDAARRPFGCNTPVRQNGLEDEWLARPSAAAPKRYAFFQVEPASPDAPDDLRRGAALLDYSQGGNRAYDIARILRDYLVRVEPGSDELLLGKAFFVVAGAPLAHSHFLIERYRPLADAPALANRVINGLWERAGPPPGDGPGRVPAPGGGGPLSAGRGDQIGGDAEQPGTQTAAARVEPVALAICNGKRLGRDVLGWRCTRPARHIQVDGAEVAVIDFREYLGITPQPGSEYFVARVPAHACGHRGVRFMSVSQRVDNHHPCFAEWTDRFPGSVLADVLGPGAGIRAHHSSPAARRRGGAVLAGGLSR